MDFERLLNYQDIEDGLPLHFVKVIKRVRDVASYLYDVPDMGMGVTGFEFSLPEGKSVHDLIEKFKSSREIRLAATPVARLSDDDKLRHPSAARRSVEHLGEHNSYFGLYHCGRYEKDLYLLLVASYDCYSSARFRNRIIAQVQSTFEHVNDQNTFRKIENYRVRNSDIMETEEYLQAVYKANVNRRAIAARVFNELGIPFVEEIERFESGKHAGQDIVTVPRHTAKFDCPTVFLQRHGEYARLFYHAYSHSDFHAGAPWFLAPHRGFYSFVQPALQSKEFKDYFANGKAPSELNMYLPHGFPTSNPRTYVETNEPVNSSLQQQVEQKVLWVSEMNIMMHANPQLFQNVDDVSCPELIRTYNLHTTQLTLWRTLVMYVSPPDPEMLDIRVSVKFATRELVRLGFETYREINHMWATLLAYETDFADAAPPIVFSERTSARKQTWSKRMLPRLSDLYALQSEDLSYTDFSVETLHCLIQAYDQAEAYICSKTGMVETRARAQDAEPLQRALNAMLVSDFSDSDPAVLANALPQDETDRDGPARSINYAAHPARKEILGEPSLSTTSGISDSDVSERFHHFQETRKRAVISKAKPAQRPPHSSGRSDEASDSSGRRRRKHKRNLVNAQQAAAQFYSHGIEYASFTSEDETILHKA